MKRTFDAKVKPKEELKTLQLEGLKCTVNQAYKGSQRYGKKLDELNARYQEVMQPVLVSNSKLKNLTLNTD